MTKCLRCGQEIEYEMSDNEATCPRCGWTEAAARTFAKARVREIRRKIAWRCARALCFFAIGAVFLPSTLEEFRNSIRLGLAGEIVAAKVVTVDHVSRSHSRRLGVMTWYTYTIQYAGHQRTWYTQVKAAPGNLLSVLYLPHDADVFMLASTKNDMLSLILREPGIWSLALPLLFVAAGCWTLYTAVNLRSQRHSFEPLE